MTNQETSSESKINSEEGPRSGDGDTDMAEAEQKEKKGDENVESSSSGSDGGKGNGSGGSGGVDFADRSSSDTSSLEAAKRNVPDMETQRSSVGDDFKDKSVKTKETEASRSSVASVAESQEGSDSGLSASMNDETSKKDGDEERKAAQDSRGFSYSAPQWNGVRINHPMDPRIDFSTVGYIQMSSSRTEFPNNVNIPSQQNLDRTPSAQDTKHGGVPNAPAPPSIDQYMTLMEIVRPFFHAHGIGQDLAEPTEPPLSDFAWASETGSDRKSSTNEDTKLKVPVTVWNTSEPAFAAHAARPNRDPQDGDSSSMVILVRAKSKILKKSSGDQANNGSNNSTNEGPNEGLNESSTSDDRVRIQQPRYAEELQNDQPTANDDNSNENDGEGEQDGRQADLAGRQESSSEGQNNQAVPQVAPMRYGGPAVVSEYSSSRAGSSGASNSNVMSTSGSGSGGNTGSGTASGSNQGGSSGSGNDHGGISSNGNGSSGSGNDVKGSSEETMDNSGENNSGEDSGGNSDGTNSIKKSAKNPVNIPLDAPHLNSAHRHASTASETKDAASPAQPQSSIGEKDQNAVREKKLQDKKRKRMNMRREYEEKVEQEMESSEGSNGREEVVIKPGRPITLDKVLSFTKIPRIVIKAGPPFFVVYTNAAYSRLSGIDSHLAVGKPISTLLSIPDQHSLEEQDARAESPQVENSTVAVATASERNNDPHVEGQSANGATSSQNHLAVEAAGRARATSAEGNTEMGLERLVAASGHGKYHAINVLSKPHHMLGRDVTVANIFAMEKKRSHEEGSNGSSIMSSHNGPSVFVTSNMSVSPVVSSPEAFDVAVVTDKDQDIQHHKTMRRKHHHHTESQQSTTGHHQHRRIYMMREPSTHRKRHLITHYVIQLEQFDGTTGKFGNASQSSTSTTVEAHILGMTKSELRGLRLRTSAAAMPPPEDDINSEDDEMESESTDPKEAVTAIG